MYIHITHIKVIDICFHFLFKAHDTNSERILWICGEDGLRNSNHPEAVLVFGRRSLLPLTWRRVRWRLHRLPIYAESAILFHKHWRHRLRPDVPFPWKCLAEKMSSSSNAEPLRLPPVSLKAPSPSKSRGENKAIRSRLELPLLAAATKAERYTRLSHFDKSRLKRQKAHVRNALKTTENIQKIAKQLNEVETNFCISW